jgi:hypothetical protein
MAMPVNIVASGGMPVVNVSALNHALIGTAVSSAASGKGIPVTIGTTGLAVFFLIPVSNGSLHPK